MSAVILATKPKVARVVCSDIPGFQSKHLSSQARRAWTPPPLDAARSNRKGALPLLGALSLPRNQEYSFYGKDVER